MRIYAAHVLERYWDEAGEEPDSFRRAFCRWADAIIEHHDRARARMSPMPRDSGGDHYRANVLPATRESVLAEHGNGTTIKDLARRHHLTWRQVVAVLRPGASGKFERYVAMEDDLLENGVPANWSAFNAKHRLTSQAGQRLAKAHGLLGDA